MTTSDPQPRIVILLPDFSGGGAERLHILLANHWHAQGIKVDFVLMRRRGDLIGLLPDGIGIFDGVIFVIYIWFLRWYWY